MKAIKKIYTSIIYYIVYNKCKKNGVHKEHAQVMAREYIRFKYYFND